jgi:signal peptide peptidase SppA
MLHARIAARAFNTPLLVEPSKAMAFLSGLGPRVLGRRVELADHDSTVDVPGTAALPVRASILAGGLTDSYRQHGEAPFPLVDGIAVIEISGVLIHRGGWIGQSSGQTSYEGIAAQVEVAASDPSVRAVALEIDSFGGEVAGVFDLADRIRALRRDKPVWAFVAEHAFSAGYALASQADRILLPRTGAVGSIGVVVMHADLSGTLDQDGVQVTLIHSGQHKVDGNPYQPLPAAVESDIQREIDGLRDLFAETVGAGRGARLDQQAALATEADTYRGVDAVTAGLADAVTELTHGFAELRQMIAQKPRANLSRAQRASVPQPRKETAMTQVPDKETTPQEESDDVPEQDAGDEAIDPPATATPANGASEASAPDPKASDTAAQRASEAKSPPMPAPEPPSAQSGNLAEVSARLRQEAAEITEIAAQAGRLGIAIDAAKALREGTTPEALRSLVLERASAAADARDVVAAPPSPALPQKTESPLVAAAKRDAAASKSG